MTTTKPSNEKPSALLDAAPVVELTDREFRIAQHVAAARKLSYRGADVGETFGDLDDLDAHLTGVLGEMAVCKVSQAELDDKIYVRGDPGHDLRLGGHRVDVKSTNTDLSLPDLLVGADSDPESDLYILAHRLDERRVRLVGWADHGTLMDRSPRKYPGSRRNYVVEFHELRPLPMGGD
jgi:hypothetical protein